MSDMAGETGSPAHKRDSIKTPGGGSRHLQLAKREEMQWFGQSVYAGLMIMMKVQT